MRRLLLCLAALAAVAPPPPPAGAAAQPTHAPALRPEDYRADALSIAPLIERVYAYPERFGGISPLSERLRGEAERVGDRRALLLFAERALLALADHHAITGASFRDSRAVVPSFADLWIERAGASYRITAVREGSPAESAGVRSGDALVAVEGLPIADAVVAFWADLGLAVTEERTAFAARVLAAGRRDRPRRLAIRSAAGAERALDLPNLYSAAPPQRPPLAVREEAGALVLRINDALGESATIAAFDAAMAAAGPRRRIILDLRDTPSGGNTVVARAILGWFVGRPAFYQVHRLPVEERETGIPRQWAEQVLPRPGKRHRGPVTVLVGRWTGSMGEGLAIGFDAIGAEVCGGPMAGLLGAIYDYRLERSGLVLKLPTERLYAVDGTPREAFVPPRR
ncbi:MAG TPA: S41 family peptidase [Allosphingosinicella sp.]|jgi:carboxyl-terminal processing protease